MRLLMVYIIFKIRPSCFIIQLISYFSVFENILQASDSNARPLQAVNKRKVYLYKPKVKLMKKYCNISSY